MNATRIIKEIMEYAINNMTLEEQKYLRNTMFSATGDLDILILSEERMALKDKFYEEDIIMSNCVDIFIDKENSALFIGIGEKMTEESVRKLKEGLNTQEGPYKAIYVFEQINSAQYITEQKLVEINSDGSFKYMD